MAENELRIKTDNCGDNDFFYQALNTSTNRSGEPLACRYEEILESGKSVPIEELDTYRDSASRDRDLYLVYEKNDLKYLIHIPTEAYEQS